MAAKVEAVEKGVEETTGRLTQQTHDLGPEPSFGRSEFRTRCMLGFVVRLEFPWMAEISRILFPEAGRANAFAAIPALVICRSLASAIKCEGRPLSLQVRRCASLLP